MSKRNDRRNRHKQNANADNGPDKREPSRQEGDAATPEAREFIAGCCKKATSDQNSNSEHSKNERNLVRLTGVLAIIGFITFLVLVAHARIFIRADETTRASQRAFIAPKGLIAKSLGQQIALDAGVKKDAQVAYSVALIWENSGNTPPTDLHINGTIAQVPAGPRTRPPEFNIRGPGALYSLFPKAAIEAQKFYTSGWDLNAVRDGKSEFILLGLATYADAFAQRHFTLACYRVSAAPIDYNDPKSGILETPGDPCNWYNCADRECQQYNYIPEIEKLLKSLE